VSGLLIFLTGSWFVLAIGYVVLAPIFFFSWLKFYRLDTDLDAEDRLISWIMLGIATLLWPLVVPFAYLSLLRKRYQEREALDVLNNDTDHPKQNLESTKSKH
jgi:hypothetical protein